MIFGPAARRGAEARASTVALAIAAKAGWRFAHAGPALATPFAGYLYVDTVQLLLVPTNVRAAADGEAHGARTEQRRGSPPAARR